MNTGATKRQHVDRATLEEILGFRLSDVAVIFTFPGLGIGEIHDCLRGCTLETNLFRNAAKSFAPLGVDVIGLSSGRIPVNEATIHYVQTPKPLSPFQTVNIGEETFYARSTFVLDGDSCEELSVAGGVEVHVDEVREWLAIHVSKRLFYSISNISNLSTALKAAHTLPCGADSQAILALPSEPPTVLKIGPKSVLEPEIAYIKMTQDIGTDLFPRLHGDGYAGPHRWYLMDAAHPHPVSDVVFSDVLAGTLHPDYVAKAIDLLSPLQKLYTDSVTQYPCAVTSYHYTQRIQTLIERTDVKNTARQLLPVTGGIDSIVKAHLTINGRHMSTFSNLVSKASKRLAQKPVSIVTLIHGDVHLSNVLRAYEGSGFVFIDPRVNWDDQPIDKFGYGDPIYDLATMFHSVSAMATILARLANGTSDTLARVLTKDSEITIELDEALLTTFNTVWSTYSEVVQTIAPSSCLEPEWEVRLLTGAAGAFFGWLKYTDAVKTQAAWWSIFAASALCLYGATSR